MVRRLDHPQDSGATAGITIKAHNSGVSGTVLDDLSGSYKTFAESVKEMISNAYDADASKITLVLSGNFDNLTIKDDGAGMNPKQFVREYIRVGRSMDAKPLSPSGKRERIGGKGIGSLAPARYCRRLEVTTKSNSPLNESYEVAVPASGIVPLGLFFPIDIAPDLIHLFTSMTYEVVEANGTRTPPVAIVPAQELQLPAESKCLLSYTFAAHQVELNAAINFVRLRDKGEEVNLEHVAGLWELELQEVDPDRHEISGTTLTLRDLESFVANDLRAPGKDGARNIGSMSGLERFTWAVSRLCPVKVRNNRGALQAKFPPEVVGVLTAGETVDVELVHPTPESKPEPLLRDVYVPHKPVRGRDASLCRFVNIHDPSLGISVHGYILGSSTVIYPAEMRGVSLRVKGVELGAPTLFGAEDLVTGPQHTALTSHITGELHVEGVNVRRDILPGREGLYPQSPVFRAIRHEMVGAEERLGGILRDLVMDILLRSEAHASAQGLIKKLENQRRAVLDAATAIAAMAEADDSIVERLLTPQEDDLQLLFYKDIVLRPEGRLASYTIQYADHLRGSQFEVEYATRQLILASQAPYLERVVDIAGERFDVVFKQAGKERMFCEVDPVGRYIFMNWDHPLRGPMGDAGYIKHCLAALVCGLPQGALNRYVQLISTRSKESR